MDLRPEAHREPPVGAGRPLVANSYNQGESGREAASRAVLGCNSEMTSRLGLVAEGRNWWRDSNSLAVGHSRLGLQVEESLKVDIVHGVHIHRAGRGVREHVPVQLLDLTKG